MNYFNQYHKQKTERCLAKMKNWLSSPMTSSEQRKAVESMKRNLETALTMQ